MMSFRSVQSPLVKREQLLTSGDPGFEVGGSRAQCEFPRRSGEDAAAARVKKNVSGEHHRQATPQAVDFSCCPVFFRPSSGVRKL